MRGKVEDELTRLQREGIISPVQFSNWAAPIVLVLKADKKNVRICGDLKMTVNQVSKLDKYPIPKIEDLFVKMAGGTRFTKLDLSQAYQQINLDEVITSWFWAGRYVNQNITFGTVYKTLSQLVDVTSRGEPDTTQGLSQF